MPAALVSTPPAVIAGAGGAIIAQLSQMNVPYRIGQGASMVMVPADQVMLPGVQASPAIVVMRQADRSAHFVVVWRRVGRWVQLMDPAAGRRWVRVRDFIDGLYRHRMPVPEADWCALRGDRLGMVFQEPMTALNPLHKIGNQVAEPLRLHLGHTPKQALARAEALLAEAQASKDKLPRRWWGAVGVLLVWAALLGVLDLATRGLRRIAAGLQHHRALPLPLQLALAGLQQPHSPLRTALLSLGSALTLVASEGGALRGGVVLALFGLGAAIPLVAVAYASRSGFVR